MPEVFVTICDIWIFIGFVFVTLAGILIPIFLWKNWAKKEKAEDEKNGFKYDYYNFDDWWNHGNNIVIGLICFSIALITSLVVLISGVEGITTITKNRTNESAFYNSMIIKGETLEQAITITDDLVNTDLYTSAVAYNGTLAQIQILAKSPMYALNFTGDYDWDAIKYINLK